jgi:hypothetical protein
MTNRREFASKRARCWRTRFGRTLCPSSKSLLDYPDVKTQEIAALAIAAIRERNHNIVKDPDRTGRVNWVVNAEDDWVLGRRT